jgi:hypothetical protein
MRQTAWASGTRALLLGVVLVACSTRPEFLPTPRQDAALTSLFSEPDTSPPPPAPSIPSCSPELRVLQASTRLQWLFQLENGCSQEPGGTPVLLAIQMSGPPPRGAEAPPQWVLRHTRLDGSLGHWEITWSADAARLSTPTVVAGPFVPDVAGGSQLEGWSVSFAGGLGGRSGTLNPAIPFNGPRSRKAVEQGDEADEAGASGGASQLNWVFDRQLGDRRGLPAMVSWMIPWFRRPEWSSIPTLWLLGCALGAVRPLGFFRR